MAQIATTNNGAVVAGAIQAGISRSAMYTEVGKGLKNLSGGTLKSGTPCRIITSGTTWGFTASGGSAYTAIDDEAGRVDGILITKICDAGEVGVLYKNFQMGNLLAANASARKRLYLSSSVTGGYQDDPAFTGAPEIGVITGPNSCFMSGQTDR